MLRRSSLAWFVFVLGCSSSDPATQDAGTTDSGAIGCATDPRAQTYAPNMQRAGDGGALQFVLISADPGPPLRGNNTWKVKLLTSAGAPVTGATLDAAPFMPEHGHGPSVAPTTTANADGTFTVSDLDFFMPGLWRVTFTATAGTVTDTASFFFCVAG